MAENLSRTTYANRTRSLRLTLIRDRKGAGCSSYCVTVPKRGVIANIHTISIMRLIGTFALLSAVLLAHDTVFDVATIHPHDPARPGFGIVIQGRRLNTVGTTLTNLIGFAYSVHPRQIVSAPAWVASDKYDIAAEVLGDEKTSNQQLMIARVQTLLADRFGLAFHRETKALPVYEIVVGRPDHNFSERRAIRTAIPAMAWAALA